LVAAYLLLVSVSGSSILQILQDEVAHEEDLQSLSEHLDFVAEIAIVIAKPCPGMLWNA